MRTFIFLLITVSISSCFEQDGNSNYFSKTLSSSSSTDGKKKLTLTEMGPDSINCYTQVLIDFGTSGTAVYSTDGRNLGIKAYWKDNHTIVIETKKEYPASQKWPQVQNFDDIVKVEYVEK